MVRTAEQQADLAADAQYETELSQTEKQVQHALAFAAGKEGGQPGMPPPEPSSTIITTLRGLHVTIHLEPIQNGLGAAMNENFLQLKDSYTDNLQNNQGDVAATRAALTRMGGPMNAIKNINRVGVLRGQVGEVSRLAYITNAHVQTNGIQTLLTISGMVRSRKLMSMDFTADDYARVKKILMREQRWQALAGTTLAVLAAYKAVIDGNGDPKALDVITNKTLEAFPLQSSVGDDEAKDYVAHLSDNVSAQKAKYETWMRKAYGDGVYVQQYKPGIDSMFAQAAGAAQQKSVAQIAGDATSKYNQDLAKCARGEQPDPGSLVGPAKCEEARRKAQGGSDDGSGVALPPGAQRDVDTAKQGMGVAQAAANGDVSGALSGAANVIPGDGPIKSSLEGVAALMRGDVKGAFNAALNVVPGGSVIKEGIGLAGKLLKLFG
jgi:hypothetical protein